MNILRTEALEVAENWFNTSPKADLLEFAKVNNINLDGDDGMLCDDWGDKLIEFMAARCFSYMVTA
jgi:hypothetical protein